MSRPTRVSPRALRPISKSCSSAGDTSRARPRTTSSTSTQREGSHGVVTSYTPDLDIDSDTEATETQTDGDEFDVFCTAEANRGTVTLTGGDGETIDERLWLSKDDSTRYRVGRVLSPPPLTARTVPKYTIDTIRYFGWCSLKCGALPCVVLV